MSWFFKLIGNSSGNGAEVDSANQQKVVTETDIATNPQNVGGIRSFSENDNGALTGSPYLKSPETSADYRLRVGIDTVLFNDTFNATAQNTSLWNYIFATLTASQPGAGTLNFGTVQGTAVTHGAIMKTFQYFPILGTAPLSVEFKMGSFISTLVANEEWRMGIGNPTVAGTAPTDGVWIKVTSSGLIGESVYNGVITQTGVLQAIGSLVNGVIYKFAIVIGEGGIEFWKNDELLGSLEIANANGQPFMQASLPAFMQKLCTGSVTNTNTMRVSDVTVSLLDLATGKSWPHQVAGMGKSGNIASNGVAQGKTSLWTNNASPTAAVLTNTTAAFTGLGGIVAVLPTLAVGSDGKLITYQNPAATINLTGRNLYITGVKINGVVSVALVGGAVAYAFALAYGHTATSLATPETGSFVTATTHAPRIMPLGIDVWGATAVVGVQGIGVYAKFSVPIVVRPGEFVDIVARNVGVVTSAGAITMTIGINSYWE